MNMEFQQKETKKTKFFSGKRVVASPVSLFTLLPSVQQVFRALSSKLSRFLKIASLAIVILKPASGSGQGTLTINFDGPPLPSYGNRSVDITSYSESGMYFGGGLGFGHADSDLSAGYPYNGTPYLQGGGYSSGYATVLCGFENGSLFGVSSVDVAGYNGSFPDFAVDFRGAYANGDLIKAQFVGTSIDFQTFQFGPEWSSGLKWFSISTAATSANGWSADNLVVIVPEPRTGALLAMGALAFSFWWSKRRKA